MSQGADLNSTDFKGSFQHTKLTSIQINFIHSVHTVLPYQEDLYHLIFQILMLLSSPGLSLLLFFLVIAKLCSLGTCPFGELSLWFKP